MYFYAIIPNAASSALWMNETLLADSVASAATTSGSLGAYVGGMVVNQCVRALGVCWPCADGVLSCRVGQVCEAQHVED